WEKSPNSPPTSPHRGRPTRASALYRAPRPVYNLSAVRRLRGRAGGAIFLRTVRRFFGFRERGRYLHVRPTRSFRADRTVARSRETAARYGRAFSPLSPFSFIPS